ncbi:MAG: hypothetical protein PHH04_00910 [Thomasclavelia sp.]|nr:hypothetical protein [Thomasclavelia sp.]
MKKILSLVIATIMCLSISGCGSNSKTSTKDKLTNTSWTAITAVTGSTTLDQKTIESATGAVNIKFKKDNVATMAVGEKSGSGKYSIKGNKVTIKSTKKIEADLKNNELSMTLDDVKYTFSKDLNESSASYKKELTAGTYTVGVDLPKGSYNLSVKSGGGSFMISTDGSEPTATSIEKKESDVSVNNIKNISLDTNQKVIVMGNVKVNMYSNDAKNNTLTKRKANVKKTKTLKPGSYTTGVDIDAGTYDITALNNTAGQVITDGKTVSGINEVMSKNGKNGTVKSVKNVELTANQTIKVTGVTVKLTPSK